MSRSVSGEKKRQELALKGEALLHDIIGLKSELQTALEKADDLRIDISEIDNFELAFLQLLCSAHRTAVQMNKSLRLTGSVPEIFNRKLEEAGFARDARCTPDCGGICVWVV